MPKNPLNKKDLQGVNTELVQIEDQIISIANSLSNAVKSALEDIKDEGKGVAEIFAKDIDKGIKGLAKGLEQTVKNQQQLVKGQLKSADISKQIEDRELKIQMIKNRINGLTAQDIGLKEELNGKLAELNDAEGYHNKLLDDQFNKSKAIEERMGAIGGIVKGISKIPILGELINAEEVMGKIQKKAAETEGAFANIEVAAFGMGQLLGSAFGTLTDPTVVFGAVLKSFQALGKEQREFRKVTGQNANTFRNIGGSLTSTTDLLKASTALSKELGVNASVVFPSETITEVAELTEFMGMGAHEAAQLAKFAKLSGQELSTVTDNMESSFKSFVKTNAVGINISDVMNDVGSASAAVTLSLGSQPAKIQAAAMEARKLGLSLEQVDKIAGSLLDFEQSIQNEMEAEMLIGKEINLDKARQLALANDLEGVAKEIGKNEGIMKAFSSGNRIQQEATAKAMGMSREEMAKMIYAQKIQGGLSAKQAADAADISLEEAKRLSAQESIAKAMEKITQAAANVLDIFAPILSNSLVLGATLTAVALVVAGKLAIGLKDSYSEMKGMVKSSLAFLKNTKLSQALVGKFYKGGQFMKGGGKAAVGGERKGGLLGGLISKVSGGGGTTDKAGGSITKLAKGTEGVKKGQGETIKGFLKGIGGGLSALGKAVKGPQLAYIAAGMGILTLSLMGIGAALGFAAPGIKAFGTVITSIFAGVATVITAVAAGFVMLMDNMTMEKVKPMLALGLALYGIAGGLALMATAGLGALPIIGALGALALVAAPLAQLAGVFGGGGDEGNGGEDKIVKKLDELIDIAKKGTVIMMDGNVVGQTVQRSSSGIGA
jgi:hypothetical protein|tara:strand:- start:7409 stop:9910 length:2502 start_codon:yes stop_codon:yes gene_type:complete